MFNMKTQTSHLVIAPFFVTVLLMVLIQACVCSITDVSSNDRCLQSDHRLRRHVKDEGSYSKEQLKLIADLMQDDPWTVLKLNDAKRQMFFTPRLGRDAGEENGRLTGTADRWHQENEYPGGMMSQRSPPFSPRLGRGFWTVSS